MKIYEVGGTIRDSFLSLKNSDKDYAIECGSYEEMKDWISKRGKIWQERPEFVTIRAQISGLGDSDFVLCRKDGIYSDGRRPDSVEIGTIRDDLSRRDFTMNAIAKDISDGSFIDPYGGVADIRAGLIRCVRNTEDRLNEDSLRMLRAIRFSVTKNMRVDKEIYEFITNENNYHLLNSVSENRIREEINKMWEKNSNAAFEQMNTYYGIFNWIFRNTGIWLKPTTESR